MTTEGLRLRVYEAGAGGPPFLFVHGFACDHLAWRPQFEDLARDHRCVAVDLRGRGDAPATPPFDAVQQADDLADVVRALDLGPVIVVGHSLGGIAALLLNDRFPELVRGVVIVDSPVRDGAKVGPGLERGAASLREAGSMEGVRSLVESFVTPDTPPDVAAYVFETMLTCPADVAAGMLSNSEAFAPRMAEIVKAADRKPFMAIWAERPLGDPRWLRDTCAFVRQEPVPGSGHFLQLEQPAVTSALLRAFLDDVERDPRLASA